MKILLISVLLFINNVYCGIDTKPGYGPAKQNYGFFDIRPGDHMFWWLQLSQNKTTDPENLPLIVWLAGCPGVAANGPLAVGLLDANGKPNPHSWVHKYNVLFLDTPIGCGYSHTNNSKNLNVNSTEIGNDTYSLLLHVLKINPKLKHTPIYLFGNSYGARTAAELANHIIDNQKDNGINLKAVLLSSGWISPRHLVEAMNVQLYEWALLDDQLNDLAKGMSDTILKLIDDEYWIPAKRHYFSLVDFIRVVTGGIDLRYLIRKPIEVDYMKYLDRDDIGRIVDYFANDIYGDIASSHVTEMMNGPVREALNISKDIKWNKQSKNVLRSINDLMSSKSDLISKILLGNNNVSVHICTGNADGIASTFGTLNWLDGVDWPGKTGPVIGTRQTIWDDEDIMQGYKALSPKISFYWMYSSGHLSFYDNPKGTADVLQTMIGY